MSKSRGNIVTPDEIISKYGADTARLFILFASPPEKQLDWSQDGLEGCWRFLNRVWRLLELTASKDRKTELAQPEIDAAVNKLLSKSNRTIRKVENDIAAEHQFNTAISSIMELVNEIYTFPLLGSAEGSAAAVAAFESVVLLLAPFTPHICEEIWLSLGHKEGLIHSKWPAAEERYLVDNTIELPVQINGKLRGKINVPSGITEAELRKAVEVDEKILKALEQKQIVKFIYVKNRIVNIIVK